MAAETFVEDGKQYRVEWADVALPRERKRMRQCVDAEVKKPTTTKPTILISRSIVTFEAAHSLPLLTGTERQVAWARKVRRAFISEVLAGLDNHVQSLDGDEAILAFRCFDIIRGNQLAKSWIEILKPHLGAALHYLKGMPAAVAAEQEKRRLAREQAEIKQQERLRKTAEGREVAKAANQFAERYDLPRLNPDCSAKHRSYGRRCRHEILSVLAEDVLLPLLPFLRGADHPGIWIGAKSQTDPLSYALQQAKKHRG